MRIGGLASGLDIQQLVSDLMKAERMPLDRLFQQKQRVEWQRDLYREVNLSITKFRDDYGKMRLQSTFNTNGLTSSDSSVATGTATLNAVPGTYTVNVTSIAAVAKVNSTDALMVGASQAKSTDLVLAAGQTETFTIRNGAGLEATITIDDTDTYASLGSKIANAVDDGTGESLGFRASFDNTTGRFFFSTKEMGSDKGITFVENANSFVKSKILSDTGLSGTNGDTYSYVGADGALTFDGIAITDLKTNNTSVNGINITLVATGTTNLTVGKDVDAAFDTIMDFVKSYNELIADIDSKLKEPRYRDFAPLTNEQRQEISEKEAELWDGKAKSGLLRNDSILSSLLTDLRRSLSDSVEGIATGEFKNLSEIGITTGNYTNGGLLFVDEQKLRDALTDKPDEVIKLFSKAPETEGDPSQMGVGRRIYEELNEAISGVTAKAGSSGVILGDQSVLGKQITRMDKDMFKWEDRLVNIENRYWAQFTAMEKALNQMNQQSAWMTQNMFGGQ